MTVINHTLTRPGGAAASGVTVRVRLVTSGYVTSSKAGILSEAFTITDSSGHWSMDLTAQSAITPANTFYLVTHELRPQAETLAIQIPDGAGPFNLADCLVTPLASPPGLAVSTASLAKFLVVTDVNAPRPTVGTPFWDGTTAPPLAQPGEYWPH